MEGGIIILSKLANFLTDPPAKTHNKLVFSTVITLENHS